MTTEQYDGYIEDAVRRLVVAHRQDQCADGFHSYNDRWPGGVNRCSCGKAEGYDVDPVPAILDQRPPSPC